MGTPQAIASSGTMPNGSYQGTLTTQVSGPYQGWHVVVADPAVERDAVTDAELGGEPGQPPVLRIPAQAARGRPARNDQLGARHTRHGTDHRVQAFALD